MVSIAHTATNESLQYPCRDYVYKTYYSQNIVFNLLNSRKYNRNKCLLYPISKLTLYLCKILFCTTF